MDIIDQKKGSGATQPAGGWTKHAPPGGITLGGKFFEGGTFIPNDDFDKASPEEKDNLARAEQLVAQYGPEEAKKMLAKFQGEEQQQRIAAQSALEEKLPQEVVYIFDNGKILNEGGYFGELIIKLGPVEITGKEIKLFNACKTLRVDIVETEKGIVISLETEGYWPFEEDKDDDLLEDLGQHVQMSQLPLDDYKLLHNLSPAVQKLIKPTVNMSLNHEYNSLFDEKAKTTAARVTEPSLKKSIEDKIGSNWVGDIHAHLYKHGVKDSNDREDAVQDATFKFLFGDSPLFEKYDESKGVPFGALWNTHLNYLGMQRNPNTTKTKLKPVILQDDIIGSVASKPEKEETDISNRVQAANKERVRKFFATRHEGHPTGTIRHLIIQQDRKNYPLMQRPEIEKHITELINEGKLNWNPIKPPLRTKSVKLPYKTNPKQAILHKIKRLVDTGKTNYSISDLKHNSKLTREQIVKLVKELKNDKLI